MLLQEFTWFIWKLFHWREYFSGSKLVIALDSPRGVYWVLQSMHNANGCLISDVKKKLYVRVFCKINKFQFTKLRVSTKISERVVL